MNKLRLNLVTIFAIAGFVFGEIYMLFTVFAPNLTTVPTPLSVKFTRALVLSLFLGPFGAAAGTGVGLLVDGLRRKLRR